MRRTRLGKELYSDNIDRDMNKYIWKDVFSTYKYRLLRRR